MGWNYWYNWAIGLSYSPIICFFTTLHSFLFWLFFLVLPTEISASAVLVNYWTRSVNNAVWITIFLVIVTAINMGGAK